MQKLSIHQRIQKALPAHFRQLHPHRELRREILRDLKGTLYPGHPEGTWYTDRTKQILPLVQQACDSLVMAMAANRPRFLVTPKQPKYGPFAGKMERALNRYAEALYLEEELQAVVREAFASVGIAKIYMADSIAVGHQTSYRMDPGRPFVQSLVLDNFCWDTTATTIAECSFFADRYRVSHDLIMSDSRFKKYRDQLANMVARMDPESEKPAHLESILDYVWLADVYVPSQQMVFTYVVDHDFAPSLPEPIARMRWMGDESGPYALLRMTDVPDEIMPVAPGQSTRLLAQLGNTIFRKLEDQARRQKTVTVCSAGNERDLEAFRDAEDGEWLPLAGGPESVKQVRADGPDAQLMGYFMSVYEQYSRASGNLTHRLGLGPSADTVGQESMIGSNVSRVEGAMQKKFVAFVRQVARSLGRLLWEDGFTIIPGTDRVPNTEYSVPDDWQGAIEPGARQGDWGDYMVDIDPESMPYRSSGEKLAFLQQQWDKMMAAAPILMQLGVKPDAKEYYAAVEKLSALPEIGQIAKFEQQPMAPQTGGGQGGAGAKGEYLHRSAGPRSEDPQQAAMQAMQAATSSGGE